MCVKLPPQLKKSSHGKNNSFQILKTGFQMFSTYFQKNVVGLEKIGKCGGGQLHTHGINNIYHINYYLIIIIK